jgi:hypothetical protein
MMFMRAVVTPAAFVRHFSNEAKMFAARDTVPRASRDT